LAYRAALADAWDFVKTHPDEVNAIEKKRLGYVDPKGPSISLDLNKKDFEFWIEVCKQVGVLHQPMDPATLVFE